MRRGQGTRATDGPDRHLNQETGVSSHLHQLGRSGTLERGTQARRMGPEERNSNANNVGSTAKAASIDKEAPRTQTRTHGSTSPTPIGPSARQKATQHGVAKQHQPETCKERERAKAVMEVTDRKEWTTFTESANRS
jgi:hypothetical protein